MRFRDPRYTGSNRCWPCTVLNCTFLAAVAGVLAAAGQPAAAAAFAVGGGLVIATRGYLVPGTPRLAAQLPEPIRARFGKVDPAVSRPATEALIAADVLTDQLALTATAARAVESRSTELLDDRAALEAAVESAFPDVAEVSVRQGLSGDENWFALGSDQMTIRQWEARPVVALDVAAATHLADVLPDWAARPAEDRAHLLALVRYGTSTCPACGEPYTTPDGPSVACCGGRSLVGERRCEQCRYSLVDRNDLPTDTPDPGDETVGLPHTSGVEP